ncbi:hypothetical protein LuPra_00093 [Luteitalea pratensis]|uniref:Uncharacterized protein n=1 Tax=Luteitalea pratensis TaxID=1855912 RepID=A0A143PGP0_LUTPR|nr:hypothetical protein LuPra_00093 [Luteitalea pratensis]
MTFPLPSMAGDRRGSIQPDSGSLLSRVMTPLERSNTTTSKRRLTSPALDFARARCYASRFIAVVLNGTAARRVRFGPFRSDIQMIEGSW